MANRRVAIVGASTSDCGRVDDKTAFQLNFQGTTRALADAGIEKSEIDGFMSLTGALPPVELAEYLGIRPNWVDSTGHGGSIWEFMVEHAAAAIAQGLVEVGGAHLRLDPRADLKKKLRMANLSFGHAGPIQFAAPFGHPVGSHYAMVARRHMHEFGTSLEQLAEVAVSTRYNAGLNPDAYYQDPITIDDVLTPRWCGTRCPSCTAASAPTAVAPSSSPTRNGPATAPRRRYGSSAPARPCLTRR